MAYAVSIKNKAVLMRKNGASLAEISSELKIAKSTSSLWLSNTKLSPTAYKHLEDKQVLGRRNAIFFKKELRKNREEQFKKSAAEMIKKIKFSKEITKLCCSLIWWCEGNKNDSTVRFTNSDPTLINIFLSLLRSGFIINESKFRALVHLHSYHNEKDQMKFWSKITKIPLNQFYKSYQKPNSGKRKHENYPGCIAISYYDVKIAKELEAIYNTFTLIK
jgi:hypothetical protein